MNTKKKNKVVVMGSFVVDLMMRADRLPVAGETIKGNTFDSGAGGKGSNQCVAASRAGADTIIITKLGDDNFADIALKSFRQNNIDTKYITKDTELSTGAALIMVDEKTSQNKIIVTLGACNNITDAEIEAARAEIESAEVLLTQLETNQSAVLKAIDIAHNSGTQVILNPAPAESFPEEYYSKIDYFTPNETEASYLSDKKLNNLIDAEVAARYFIAKGIKNCIITMGKSGALLCNKDICQLFPPFKVNSVDSTGAGDAFNGGLAAAIANGKNLKNAMVFASATAALSVTKIGTAKSMPAKDEIEKFLISHL